jgi:cephalosporin hydroxylase
MNLIERVNANIEGRMALFGDGEAVLLIKYASLEGDHVEIGCLWGGTAVLAALAKIEAGVKGKVYTIDFMTGGYWVHGDPCVKSRIPTYEDVINNLHKFGVEDSVTVVKTKSNPWPLDKKIKPITVLIDGGHSYEDCLIDWQNVKALEPDYVLIHDYNTDKHPGVQSVVDDVIFKDTDWQHIETVGTLIVFKKANG